MRFQFALDGTPVKKPAAIAAPAVVAGGSTATGISQRIVENALTEWRFFEKGSRREGDDPQFRRIGEYWQTVGESFDGRTLIPSGTPGKLINPAWSSAFISHVVKLSGGGDRFKYAQAHAIYVQDFVSGRPGGLYEAMRPETYAPQLGDIVHAGREEAIRMDFDAARAAFKANKRYPSHSDFVIEVKPDEGIVVAMGGNVSQSVSPKRLKINKDRDSGGAQGQSRRSALDCRVAVSQLAGIKYGPARSVSRHAGGMSRDAQLLMKASRSALITSACVVGMPCGKPG